MLNTAKHAETCCRPLTPLFKKWGQGAAAWFFHVLQRSEHVSPCSVFFNVLNIEHVQIFFFHVQKTISCLLMFTHVQHVQHVLSLFRACSQGLNMLNMQLTVKMAIIFLIMFHFSILCSVSSAPKIKWKGKVSYGLHHSSPPATWTYWDHPAQNPAQNCWDHPAQNGRSGEELLPDGQV